MALGPAIDPRDRNALHIMRGAALDSYSAVEASLCRLFAHLLGTDDEAAGTVFYRINNARSRNTMIEKLLKQRHGAEFNLFWNSLERLLRTIAETRNSTVHWQTVIEIGDTGVQGYLHPPNIAAGLRTDNVIRLPELQEFRDKCSFISRSINIFKTVLGGWPAEKLEPDTLQAYREICLQPITYPPPDNHPLSQT